jgi:hypothetical protein
VFDIRGRGLFRLLPVMLLERLFRILQLFFQPHQMQTKQLLVRLDARLAHLPDRLRIHDALVNNAARQGGTDQALQQDQRVLDTCFRTRQLHGRLLPPGIQLQLAGGTKLFHVSIYPG